MPTLPPAHGLAFRLAKGEGLKLTNTYGSQVVDTWALNAEDTSEVSSVEQTRRMLGRLFPAKGDALYSDRRNAMLLLEEDTSPGQHDMLFASCTPWIYQHYGCPPGHRNCRDNFYAALDAIGVPHVPLPNPLNLWMNIPVTNNRDVAIATPLSKPGDWLVLRALMDTIVVLSSCPMDVTPINGDDRTPKPVDCEVLAAA
jgi:uncharacterized protein YcgI (DUF1989 family)